MRPTGALPSPPDARDWPVAMKLAKAAPALPDKFRVGFMPRIYDQGYVPACVATTAAGVREWHERFAINGSVALDWQGHYARCKQLDGIPNADGTYPRVSNDILLKEGIPNVVGRGADHMRIKAYYLVPNTLDDIKRTLFEKQRPLRVAMNWYSAWAGAEGAVIEDPFMYGGQADIISGHELYCWGFDDNVAGGSLLFRNSWGPTFGLNGNCYIPYRWLLGPDLSGLYEAWYLEV